MKTAAEIRAEIGRLQALLKTEELREQVAHVLKTTPEPVKAALRPVVSHDCPSCSGMGKLEQGRGSGRWVICPTCHGSGSK